MSRTEPVIVAGRELTPEDAARRAAFFDDKLRGGIDDIAQRIYELFNVKVTPYYVKTNIAKKRLRSRIIRRRIYCSDRDLFDFIILGNPAREVETPESASA